MRDCCIILYLMLLLFSSCVFEEDFPSDEGVDSAPVAIDLTLPGTSLRSPADVGAITDETVSRVRVMAFDRGNAGRCELNQLVESPTDPFSFLLHPGEYDIFFLVNEPKSRSAELDRMVGILQLHAFSISRDELVSEVAGEEGLFVMSAMQKQVVVQTDYTRPPASTSPRRLHAKVSYTDRKGIAHSEVQILKVEVLRLAAKVNLKLVYKDDPDLEPPTVTDGVKILGLPAAVPVVEGVQSVIPDAATDVPVVLNRATLDAYPNNPDKPTYEGYTAIIPSYHFMPVGTKEKAARLSVQLVSEDGVRTREMKIGHVIKDTDALDYTLHRNTVYHITGRVNVLLDLEISVLPWNGWDIDQELGIALLPEIYLSSNSPLHLKKAGYLQISGEAFSIDNVVLELEGNDNGWVTLRKTDTDWVLEQVGGHTIAGGTSRTYSELVEDNKQVGIKLMRKKGGTVFQTGTVYLNRVELAGTVWIDRCIGQPTATSYRSAGLLYYYRNGEGNNLAPPNAPDRSETTYQWKDEKIPCPTGYTLANYNQVHALTQIAKLETVGGGDVNNTLCYVKDEKRGVMLVYPFSGHYTWQGTGGLTTSNGYHYEWGRGGTAGNLGCYSFRKHNEFQIDLHTEDMTNIYPIRCVKE